MTAESRPAPAHAASQGSLAYLTPDEVAAMLQVSPKSIYRWAQQDATMPALKIGRVVRFPRERLEAWLASREQGLRPMQKLLRGARPGEAHPTQSRALAAPEGRARPVRYPVRYPGGESGD